MLSGIAGAIFFVAWQVAAAPPWLWLVGLILLGLAGGVVVGWYRRDADGNGIPDRLEKRPI
jgi:hypothetical protein